MRIVTGRWAGTDLVSPAAPIRPTAEAVRVLAIELLGPALPGARVLDLFAGSGAVGLEALSRGARSCDFVESSTAALHALKANVALVRARARTRIFDRDAIPFVERLPARVYDIAFVDPPYGSAKLERVLQRWQAIPFSTLLLLEHQATDPPLAHAVRRRCGETALTLLRAPAPAADRLPRHPDTA